jgi:RNA polymerase sigma factor (sigma-70 family)
MSLTRTTEHPVITVLIQGKMYAWDPKQGLDPAAIPTVSGYIHQEAFKLERLALKSGHTVDDLIQEGHIGALMAARKFDPCQGLNFLSYASPWIRAYMLATVRRGIVVVPLVTYRKLCQAGEQPGAVTSLDLTVGEDETPLGTLMADKGPNPAEELQASDRVGMLRRAMRRLKKRDRDLLKHLYGFHGVEESRSETSQRMSLGRERVRQLQKVAEARLLAQVVRLAGGQP